MEDEHFFSVADNLGLLVMVGWMSHDSWSNYDDWTNETKFIA